MLPLSKSTIGIAAGVGGLLFVGYCFYFDRQRHADPNFKRKLREKRKQKRQAKFLGSKIPDLRTEEAIQKFFIDEVSTGEDCLGRGEIDKGLDHLGNAIAVCAYPAQILTIFANSLPPQAYHLLTQRLPMIGQNIKDAQLALYGNTGSFNSAFIPGFPTPGMMAALAGAQGHPQPGPPIMLAMDEELE